jgi:hypothetical protein
MHVAIAIPLARPPCLAAQLVADRAAMLPPIPHVPMDRVVIQCANRGVLRPRNADDDDDNDQLDQVKPSCS